MWTLLGGGDNDALAFPGVLDSCETSVEDVDEAVGWEDLGLRDESFICVNGGKVDWSNKRPLQKSELNRPICLNNSQQCQNKIIE